MHSSDLHPLAESNQETARQWKMDSIIGRILQAGVLLSLAFVSIGLIWNHLAGPGAPLDEHFAGTNLFQIVAELFKHLARGPVQAGLLINLGIAVLMLTPYVCVLASAVYFGGVLKNWKYTLFSAIVFTVLSYWVFVR